MLFYLLCHSNLLLPVQALKRISHQKLDIFNSSFTHTECAGAFFCLSLMLYSSGTSAKFDTWWVVFFPYDWIPPENWKFSTILYLQRHQSRVNLKMKCDKPKIANHSNWSLIIGCFLKQCLMGFAVYLFTHYFFNVHILVLLYLFSDEHQLFHQLLFIVLVMVMMTQLFHGQPHLNTDPLVTTQAFLRANLRLKCTNLIPSSLAFPWQEAVMDSPHKILPK